jgi:uncharacterized protein (TIGR04255 family)
VPKSFPDYANPPVIEVVCGVGFASLPDFKAVHLGLLWERFRKEFPRVEEQAPLAMPLEQFGVLRGAPSELQFVEVPPLPRVWFLDEKGNGIVQVQRDALLHNWRKLDEADRYPRFKVVFAEFMDYFGRFSDFVRANELGALTPAQYDLTYVNHIFPGDHWHHGDPLNSVFPDFQWRQEKRFLPVGYEAAQWKTAMRLPDESGRLHVSIQTGFKRPDNAPLIVLEMKARGMSKSPSVDAMTKWFDVAHEWIVRGFADITDKKLQGTLWGAKS